MGSKTARIGADDFESHLLAVGAKFVYVFDPEALEGRTWDNAGSVEDVATGSAAGPAAAYLLEHGLIDDFVVLPYARSLCRKAKLDVCRDRRELGYLGRRLGRASRVRGAGRQP